MDTHNSQRGTAVPLLLAILLVLSAAGGAYYYSRSRKGAAVQEKEDIITSSPTAMLPELPLKTGEQAAVMEFTMAGYQNAVKTGKLVILYYYANWCPDCKTEFPIFQSAIAQLNNSNIAAFRVNYNDSDTSDEEKSAAKTFQVGYQHTKVFIKNGVQVLKNGEPWNKARYDLEITNALK